MIRSLELTPAILLSLVFASGPVLAEDVTVPIAAAQEPTVPESVADSSQEVDDGSLFGPEVPPFELGWSHAPVIGVISFGKPFGVSSSYAAVYGPDSVCAKPVNWGASCTGLMAGAEFGLGGGRVGLGAGTVTAGKGHFGVMMSGMRTWSKPAFFESFPIQNYRGVEIVGGYDICHVSMGAYFPARGDKTKKASYAWSVGAGF